VTVRDRDSAVTVRDSDARLNGQAVRVTSPVPAEVWNAVAGTDPCVTPFQLPAWRDCICYGGDWADASRLYELPGGRQLVLMLARRPGRPRRLAVEASWPGGWGSGGLLATGGVRPEDVALVNADLAAGRSLSVRVRPGFAAAELWAARAQASLVIPRTVHVAHFDGPFEDYFNRSVSAKRRAMLRNARRHLERAGVVITDGNSPELVRGFYDAYLQWIAWRAVQRKVPVGLARWRTRRAEPLEKFTAMASRLGEGCRIWVAWWEGRPIGATISLYAGDSAVGWRAVADRSAPPRFRVFELLAVEALRHACESGRRRMELGESVGKEDLARVKERIGGQEQASPEFCFERIPLAQGRLTFERLRRQAEQRIIGHRHGDRQVRDQASEPATERPS
jgi:hypothetical protein